MTTIYSQYHDDELLRLLPANDREAFDTLYHRYWEELYDTAFFMVRDPAVCKDIVQDIFIWLWEKRHGLNIRAIKPYLKAAVKFKVANWIRSGSSRENFYETLSALPLDTEPPTPAEQTEINELSRIIREAIGQLPGKCRQIYLLKREEHLSNSEIAERLSVSVKTVENQITIAQKKIRSAIGLSVFILLGSSLIN